jgi:RHS repeat-associated protein
MMDAVGDRLSKADSVDGTTSYVYDANDRFLNETNGANVTNYVYDNNGNTKSKTKGTDITLYSWNDQGRLVSVRNPSSDAVSYEYNENGIRVSSTINGVKTSYLLDANRDYAQVLEEYDNSGTKVSYLYGHDLISQNRDGAKSFYLYDGLGSTKALTDSSGVVTDRYIYDAYGNVLSSIGTTQNSYLYTGEQFDAGAGQYYLRDRYYNQAVGRFTRSDKFEGNNPFSLVKPISLHKYLYGNSNPVMYYDPKGLFATSLEETSAVFSIIEVLSTLYIGQIATGRLLSGFGGGDDEWDGLLTGFDYSEPIAVSLPADVGLSGLVLGARNSKTQQEGFWAIALVGGASGLALGRTRLPPNLPLDTINEKVTLHGPAILGTAAFFGEVFFAGGQVGNIGLNGFTIGFGYGVFDDMISQSSALKFELKFGYSQPIFPLSSKFLPGIGS